jgi:hypothetical protein
MKRELFDPDKCKCWDCGAEFPYIGTESPMVSDKIWKQIASDEPQIQFYDRRGETWVQGGFLCKDCMEKRLGRPLQWEDLKDYELGHPVPFNKYFVMKYFPENAEEYKKISIV